MSNILEMKNIIKSFGEFHAVNGVDFSLTKGEIVAIIGPSGSGKSSLLKCINGLVEKSSGEVILNGTTGMVFQFISSHDMFKKCDVRTCKSEKNERERS